jgi:hypothetical protein
MENQYLLAIILPMQRKITNAEEMSPTLRSFISILRLIIAIKRFKLSLRIHEFHRTTAGKNWASEKSATVLFSAMLVSFTA